MQFDPALNWLLVLLFLPIFVGVASVVNAAVGRRMINGALVFLVVAAVVFALAVWRAFSNPANTSYEAGYLIGHYFFWFGIPMIVAAYFAVRFGKK
jgi:uncharacterized membrane protein HdeD (DUF308 family)